MSFGEHIYKEKNYVKSIATAADKAKSASVTMGCIQLFVLGPRSTTPTISEDEIPEFIAATKDLKVYVHSSYFSNPWGAKPELGLHCVAAEMKLCEKINAQGLVIHLPKVEPASIAKLLPKLLSGTERVKIFLEIESYKASDTTYETSRKIAFLLRAIKETLGAGYESRVGICIDTAHLWAAGTSLSTIADATNYTTSMDEVLEETPVLIHLNDQIHPFGAGRDEHASLTHGLIWKPAVKDGLDVILAWAIQHGYDCILERHAGKPKLNGKPEGDNLISDYTVISSKGFGSA